MRRSFASSSRLHPPRFGAVLALVALLMQLLVPAAAAFAMGDPLAAAPICTSDAKHTDGHNGSHKTLHAACPLCQAQSVAWGFVPPVQVFVAGPQRLVHIVWRHETIVAAPANVAGWRARGPPGAA